MESIARRMYALVEPVHLVTYFADEPTAALMALGHRNYWDGYFAGRAAPLGEAPASVVDAVFYNFAPGEVARHVPRVWRTADRGESLAAREAGSVAALTRILDDFLAHPGALDQIERIAETCLVAALAAPAHGRALFSGLRELRVPHEPLARLWHAATMLREHRGEGHNIALAAAGVTGLEAHILHALSDGIPARKFGRVHHLPPPQLTAVIDDLRDRGLLTNDDLLSQAGRDLKAHIEALTDELAAPAYTALTAGQLDLLADELTPIADQLNLAGSR